MPRFLCDRCRRPLTAPVVKIKVPPPVPGSQTPGVRTRSARLPRGSYAPSFRLTESDIDVPGFIVHPDDVQGTDQHPDPTRSSGCCQGPAGGDGLNLVCSGCGAEVATVQADCYTQNQVVLEPAAVCLSFEND
ncbi:hypothetical protein [Yinghuangia sp. YIM S10712]|uniref:hypothetical protein n=1 Tax=Yinghuangia sp. YIM S10712 TaxID=3436930 RepID=UPI003F52CE73